MIVHFFFPLGFFLVTTVPQFFVGATTIYVGICWCSCVFVMATTMPTIDFPMS